MKAEIGYENKTYECGFPGEFTQFKIMIQSSHYNIRERGVVDLSKLQLRSTVFSTEG